MNYYAQGKFDLPQDYTKAFELYHRAGELGSAEAYCNVGNSYDWGEGVEVDRNMARHYYELAAMRGCVTARFNLGAREVYEGNHDRALKRTPCL